MLAVMVFRFLFNVSSLSLMFFVWGFLGLFCLKLLLDVCVGVVVILW